MSTARELLRPSVRRWLDRYFRATSDHADAVYQESLRDGESEIDLWMESLDQDIRRLYPKGVEEKGRIVAQNDLSGSAVALVGDHDDASQVEWNVEGELFRLQCQGGVWSGANETATIRVRAIGRCPEQDCQAVLGQYVRLRRKEPDIALLTGLTLEFGESQEVVANERTIARCKPDAATIQFFLHPATGRLWVTAIDEVSKRVPGSSANPRSLDYDFCSIENCLQHECAHVFLTLNPEMRNVQGAVAISLGQLRESGAIKEADADSLMLLAQSLNPHYAPAVVAKWMDHVREDGDHSPTTRHDPVFKGLLAGDNKLAAELCAEAFYTVRWSERGLPEAVHNFAPAAYIRGVATIPLDSPRWVETPSGSHVVRELPPDKTAIIWDYVPLSERLESAARHFGGVGS